MNKQRLALRVAAPGLFGAVASGIGAASASAAPRTDNPGYPPGVAAVNVSAGALLTVTAGATNAPASIVVSAADASGLPCPACPPCPPHGLVSRLLHDLL